MFYPEELVEEIRSRNDIVDVIGGYVRLQKKGSNYMGLCPFHNEKTPSFSVSQTKQMYHCFGCGVGGNVFTFLMEYENYTFVEALKELADRAGIKLPEEDMSPQAKQKQDEKARLFQVNKEAAKYFVYQLKSERGRDGYEYLKNRGITDETIRKFGLGYSNKFSNDLYQYLKEIGYNDEFLSKSGLVTFSEKGAYDKFWNRVMYPIMDANNKVIAFGGRVMGEGEPKYLNSPETGIFDKSRNLYGLNFAKLSKKPNFIICEGYMDVIALHQAGFTNAVASLGTAFTGLQANLLKRYTSEVLLTYDSDAAGTKAALRAIPILKEAGLSMKVINMKPYKDPDEFIKALGADEFQKRIDEARNSFFFEIDTMMASYQLDDPEQKAKFYHELAKRLLEFTEELERNVYVESVAKTYNIDVLQLKRYINQLGSQIVIGVNETKTYSNTKPKDKNDDGFKQSQRLLLTWMIEDERVYQAIKKVISPEDFSEDIYQRVAAIIYAGYEEHGNCIAANVISKFQSKEEQTLIAALFSEDLKGEVKEAEKVKALRETAQRMKENSLNLKSLEAIQNNDIAMLQQVLKEQTEVKKQMMSLTLS